MQVTLQEHRIGVSSLPLRGGLLRIDDSSVKYDHSVDAVNGNAGSLRSRYQAPIFLLCPFGIISQIGTVSEYQIHTTISLVGSAGSILPG